MKNVTIKPFIVTNIKEAAEIMEKLPEKNPEDEKLLRTKMFALNNLNRFTESMPIIEKLLEKNPEDEKLLRTKIFALNSLGRFTESIHVVEKLLEKNPEDERLLRSKIFALNSLNRFTESMPIMEKLLEKNPEDEKLLRTKIFALNSLGRFTESIHVVEKLLEKNPEDEKLLRSKMFALNSLNRFTESMPIMEKLLEKNPENERLLRSKMFALNELNRFTESMPIIEKFLEKNPEDERLLRSKMFALNNLNRFTESMPIMEKFLEKNPEDERLLRSKIFALNNLNRFTESMPIMEKLLEKNPEDEKLLRSKIFALNSLNRFTESMPIMEKLLEKNPEDEKLLRSKIFALNSLNRFTESMPIIEKSLEKNPEDEKLLRSKMFVLNRLNRFTEFIEIVEKLLLRYPDDGSLLSNKAYGLVRVSKYLESTNLLEYIFDHYPNNFFNLASLFARILHLELPKRDNHAFIDLKISKNTDNLVWILVKCRLFAYEQKYNESKKFIEGNPQLINKLEFQNELAFCYESTYEIDKAISLYTSILEKYPDDAHSLFGRSQAYIANRKYDLAMEDLERANSINSAIRCKLSMAFILGITGKYNEAMDVLKVCSEIIQDSKVILKLKGIIHRKNQHFESSLECYEQLLVENPNDVDGLVGTALVYEDTEQYNLAINQIDKILEHEGFVLDAMKIKVIILTKIGNFLEARNNLDIIIQKTSDFQVMTQTNQLYDSIRPVLESMVEEQVRAQFTGVEGMTTKTTPLNEIEDLFNSDLKTTFQQRESDILEFKSTLRYDLDKKQVNKNLEHGVMKTICGFLNSRGGCLIVGYSDDKKICGGLEKDYETLGRRKNWDGWQQYLESKIKTSIGSTFSGFITIRSEMYKENNQISEVAKIKVKKSTRAAYLKENNLSIFYVRRNGQTDSLDVKEAYYWINDHDLR